MSTIESSDDVSERLREVMRRYWGYEEFRPLQERAMRAGVAHRDSLVVLPTGGGKSLCYQVPALCLEGMAVVISPLISLMKDQVDALTACGVPAAFINSTLSVSEKREAADAIRERRVKLLYVAPERLSLAGLLDLLESANVSFFAIDEAHCVSMWGHDFRPHYRQLSVLRERFPEAAIHGYTATATQQVCDDVVRQLGLRDPEVLVGSFDRPNLTYRVDRRDYLVGQVLSVVERHPDESGIVYCITRKEVDNLCGSLQAAGHSALPYHAGMNDEDRKANQEAFIEDRCRMIVATVAFGMGIDKSDVRYVVHAGLPKSLENYQQESGRAGRDGLEAECCLFYSGADYKTWEFIVDRSEGSPDFKRAQMASLKKVMDYCDGLACRHRTLVRHFGQDLDSDCGEACDICLGEFDEVDEPLVVAQKIVSSVYRQDQKFGTDYTAKVLKGSKEQRILDNGHDRLSTHGLLKDEARRAILDWIGQLIQQGFLVKVGEYDILRITEEGWKLLRGEVTPRLLTPASGGRQSSDDSARGRSRKQVHDPHSWEGVDRALFDVLRSLRTQRAVERGLAPYLVFGDATLRDMARRRPTTPEGFLKVHGIGQKKCDDYAAEFTAAITEHCRRHDLETDVDPPAPAKLAEPRKRDASEGPKGPSGSALQAFTLFDAGKSVDEVAEQMARAISTTSGYFGEWLRERNVTDASRFVEPEQITTIEAAIAEVGAEKLRPIRERVGEAYSYETIRIVATCWQNRQQPTSEDSASGGR